MRILLVQDAEWTKKGPHQQHHLMERLSLKGHDILVVGFDQLWKEGKGGIISGRKVLPDVCRFYKGAKVTFIRPFFIRFPILDYVSFLFSSGYEVQAQVKFFNPDVVIGLSSILSNFWGMYFAKKANIPFIYYWLDVVHELSLPKPFVPLAVFLEKVIIKNSDAVLAINQGLKDYLINFGSDPSTTYVINGGIDFDRFQPSYFDRKEIREKYGFALNDFVLFFVGWIYKFSGLQEIIIELSKDKNKYENFRLLIVGDGDYYNDLKNIVKDLNLERQVILKGKRPYNEIPELIALSDICLLPAHNNEIMDHIVPIKLYEYLAMHKLVISTKLPGIIKEFGYDSGIIYVDYPEDAIKLAAKLSDEDFKSNELNASKFIKGCNWTNVVDKFESLLKNLAYEGTKK